MAPTAKTTTATTTPTTDPTPAPTPTVVPLPKWTDAASVASYITSVVGAVFAFITGLHPGFTEPTAVQAILPAIGAIVAAAAQIVNVVTHRAVHKALIAAGK